MNSEEENIFYAGSMYGAKTKQALVNLRFGREELPLYNENFTVLEAKKIAYMILDACEAAITDAALFEFLLNHVGLPMENCAQMMLEMRKWRNKEDPRYFEE